MREQLQFIMHPNDEKLFLNEILNDPNVVLINGPRWKNEKPEVHRSIEPLDYYCIIWSPNDLPILEAEFIESCNDWYCRSEFATIQFLRSNKHDKNILTEGRIAISTKVAKEDEANHKFVKPLESRYKGLRKFIKKYYSNSLIIWENVNLPRSPKTSKRSANPSDKPDNKVWIGPNAINWLKEDQKRCVKQNPTGFVEGRLE